jgi:hypothetical protein
MLHVMKVRYVTKRRDSNVFYFKFNIPKDCCEHFGGRTEIQKYLDTTDISEAEKLTCPLFLINRFSL